MTLGQRLNRHVRRLCLLLIFLVTMMATASAAFLRGRLDRIDPHNGVRVAAGGVPVTVWSQATRARSSPATSGQDGMYYIYNVPAGVYYLEVWVNGLNGQPMVYQISVNEPYSDVAPIVVP